MVSHSQRTQQLSVDADLCRLCARCLVQRGCRGMAIIRFDRDEPPVIDPARCAHCLICLDKCPFGAVIWA